MPPLRDTLGLLTKWFSKKSVLKKVQEKVISAIKSGKDRVGKSKPFFKIGFCQQRHFVSKKQNEL